MGLSALDPVAFVVSAVVLPLDARVEGAYAFGQNAVTGGWAGGTACNYSTAMEADNAALQSCGQIGPNCQIISHFDSQCFAIVPPGARVAHEGDAEECLCIEWTKHQDWTVVFMPGAVDIVADVHADGASLRNLEGEGEPTHEHPDPWLPACRDPCLPGRDRAQGAALACQNGNDTATAPNN